jgi:hypothetical protein
VLEAAATGNKYYWSGHRSDRTLRLAFIKLSSFSYMYIIMNNYTQSCTVQYNTIAVPSIILDKSPAWEGRGSFEHQ